MTILFEGLLLHSWEFALRALEEIGSGFILTLLYVIFGLIFQEEIDLIFHFMIVLGMCIGVVIFIRLKQFIRA